MLKEQVKSFLETSEIPKTSFCKHCGISMTTLIEWQNGKRYISDTLKQRMTDFMVNYVKTLVQLTQNN